MESAHLLKPAFQRIVPDFFFAEVTNSIWKKVQRKELSEEEGSKIVDDLLRAPLDVFPSKHLAVNAMQLALELSCPVYDCLYLSLALSTESKLVTADRKFFRPVQQSRFGKSMVWVEDLAD